jgi:non-canonical poly(A) RNA polymerase PAPD5/7
MTDGPARFRDLAELSESMDESDSSESRDADPTGDSPRKRQKTESATELIVTSKWSNPDPYTVLPPAGEQLRGRKTDVVQLIRKAKITASEANSASRNDISGNMDFVPLDFGSEPEDEIESGEVPDDEIMQNLAYENSTESQTLASRIKRVNGGTATYTFGEGQKSGSDNGFLASEDISDHHTFSAVDASITSRIEQSTAINTTVLVESFPTRSGQLRDSRKRKLNLTHDGDIVQDWLAMSENIKAPWLTIDHSETNHMGLWYDLQLQYIS